MLVIGLNSWATVAEADAYLTDRIGATAWFSLDETPATPGADSKESMLISAFYWLTASINLTADLTGANVKNAQIEAALFLLEHYSAYNERRAAMYGGVVSFEYSERSEDFNIDNLSVPDNITGLVPEYGTTSEFPVLRSPYDV